MSSTDGQIERKFFAACSLCIFAFSALSTMVRMVWIPQGIRRSHMLSCRSNRRVIGEQETLYKQKAPTHRYTTDLQKLNSTVPYNTCPENGTYSIVIRNGQAEVHCSIRDHDTLAVP